MVKRFLIAAIIVGLFLGGVGYFNLVFKPKMIGEFMAKMVPPPATVTAEAAKSERWTDRVRAIGTLVAIEGVDVAPQVGGTVTDYFFDSGHDVEKGDKLVKLDTSVEEADLADNKATLTQAILDFDRQVKPRQKGRGVASHARSDHRQARFRRRGGAEDRGDHRAEDDHRAVCRAARACATSRRDNMCRRARRWSGCKRSIRSGSTFPWPEAAVGKFTIGSHIELAADAYPGEMFKGEVEAFDAKLSQDARMLMVRARVPNPDRKLLPGMFANVAVLAGGAKEFVTVPRTAVTYGLYGDSVWVVKEGAAEPAAAPPPTAQGRARGLGGRGRCHADRRRSRPSPSSPRSAASCAWARARATGSPFSKASKPASRWSPAASSNCSPAPPSRSTIRAR